MSVFAYFVPKKPFNEVADDFVESLGLRPRLSDCFGRLSREYMVRAPIHGNGPDGGPGTLITPARFDGEPSPLWSRDKWECELSDNGKFWICWLKGAKPGPADLRRRTMLEGVSVEMLDGNAWLCPTIRKALCMPRLPSCYTRRNGKVTRQVVAEYHDLWEASGRWTAGYLGDGIGDADLYDASAASLAVNYRVGDEELRILALMDGTAMRGVLEAAIDLQFLKDASTGDQKKSDLLNGLFDAANSTPGGEDSIPDTALVAES